jgi:hypothetical protein
MSLSRVAVAGSLLGVAACTTVRSVQPAEYLMKNNPEVVWVTYTNNAVVAVVEPEIAGDTLKGTWQGRHQSVAIPLDQVRRMQAKVPDQRKTILLVTGALAGFGASVYALWISKAGDRTDGVDCGVDPDGHPYTFC